MKKWLTLLLPLAPIFVTSCADLSNNSQLEKIIQPKYNNDLDPATQEKAKSEKILDSIVEQVFPNYARKVEFLKTQNNTKNIKAFFEKYKEISEEFSEAQKNLSDTSEIVSRLNELASKNWLIVLRNITKFRAIFDSWLTFPQNKAGSHSQKYLDSLKKLKEPSPKLFSTNYWEELIEGDESAEFANTTILYLKKQNIFLRMSISDALTDNPIFNFPGQLWYFPKSNAINISTKILTDIVHSAYIHGDQIGYDRFEDDMVKKYRYGEPANFILLSKDVKIQATNNNNFGFSFSKQFN